MNSEDAADVTHEINTKLRGQAARDLFRRILSTPDATEEGLKDLSQRLTILEQGVGRLVSRVEADGARPQPQLQSVEHRLDRLEEMMGQALGMLENMAAEMRATHALSTPVVSDYAVIASAPVAIVSDDQSAQAQPIEVQDRRGEQSADADKPDVTTSEAMEVDAKVRVLHVVGGALLFVFAAVGGAYLWRS